MRWNKSECKMGTDIVFTNMDFSPFFSLNLYNKMWQRKILKQNLLHTDFNKLQTCIQISVVVAAAADFVGIVCGMILLYLSALEMPSLFPHQNHQQTERSRINITSSIRVTKRPKVSLKVITIFYLVNPESESYTLDYELFFFRATTNHFELCGHSLHVLHG